MTLKEKRPAARTTRHPLPARATTKSATQVSHDKAASCEHDGEPDVLVFDMLARDVDGKQSAAILQPLADSVASRIEPMPCITSGEALVARIRAVTGNIRSAGCVTLRDALNEFPSSGAVGLVIRWADGRRELCMPGRAGAWIVFAWGLGGRA